MNSILKKIAAPVLAGALCLSMAACTKQEEKKPEPETPVKTSEDYYMEFLNGSLGLYAGSSFLPYTEFNEKTGEFEDHKLLNDDTPITINVLEQTIGKTSYSADQNGKLVDASYAFIDCGNDGEPELLLQLSLIDDYNETAVHQLIIKNYDGKLKLCTDALEQYRSYASLCNKYGLIKESGSYGAALSSYSEYYIDKDGQVCPIYGCFTDFNLAGDYEMYGDWFSDFSQDEMYELFNFGDNSEFTFYTFPDGDKETTVCTFEPYSEEIQKAFVRTTLNLVTTETAEEMIEISVIEGIGMDLYKDSGMPELIKLELK